MPYFPWKQECISFSAFIQAKDIIFYSPMIYFKNPTSDLKPRKPLLLKCNQFINIIINLHSVQYDIL